MIFYLADNTLFRTKAEAPKNALQIDIPTDKDGLQAYIQNLMNRPSEAFEKGFDAGATRVINSQPEQEEAGDFAPAALSRHVERLGELGTTALDLIADEQDAQGVSAAFARGVCLLNVIAAGEHQLARIFLRERKKK